MVKRDKKTLRKLLNEVIALIIGRQAESIADLLDSEKHVNEFILAKKLGITINQTRNILYKISDQGLVSSIRKKDKRKGWYTYFWKIEIVKALEFLKGFILKRIDQLRNQLKSRETKQFYICELCNVEFNEENALLKDFTCSECGSVFVLKDNTLVIKELKKNIDKLNEELKLVESELEIEKEKIEKKLAREIKKNEKKKKEVRRAKLRARRKLSTKKKLENKKTVKKVKKKVVKRKVAKTNVVKKKKPIKKTDKKKLVRRVKKIKTSKKKPVKRVVKKRVVKKKVVKKKKRK